MPSPAQNFQGARMTGNEATIWAGGEKSLVEVRRKMSKWLLLSDLTCSSACLMVRGVEMESDGVALLRPYRRGWSFMKIYGQSRFIESGCIPIKSLSQ
jgi:hypothetical protein